MKRILVPCDFSDHAVKAYEFALNIANKSNGEVIVLYVIDLPVVYETTFGIQPNFRYSELVNELSEDANNKFNKMRGKQSKIKVSFDVKNGAVTSVIRQYIKDLKIDLVVMGTLGASGWREYMIGSNTEKIVRFSTVPVIAVPDTYQNSPIKNIVLPSS